MTATQMKARRDDLLVELSQEAGPRERDLPLRELYDLSVLWANFVTTSSFR